ncbi:MAG: amidohydrolase family protein, partial [Eubacteriales bacterium]|nr:amidohydrolase family protein [Eubacteriales bacterium]
MLDVKIRNASILDGTGSAAFTGDVGIANGKIVRVGCVEEQAAQTVDGTGLILAPGFVDVHSHSDLFAFVDPLRASKLCQGITTEICGQCGLGPAPIDERFFPYYTAYFQKQGAPIYPDAAAFTSFSKYLARMETLATGTHLAYFIPHGTVRMAAMGLSPEKADTKQVAHMRELVRDGMAAGALGLSSGLMYAPGNFADEAELTALVEEVGAYNGIYTSHMRNQADKLIDSVRETIRVAQNGGARANISHHKASGKANWGKVKDS